MSNSQDLDRRRLEDLLADAAVGPISIDDEIELAELCKRFPEVDCNSYEWAAAAFHLTSLTLDSQEQLPAELRQRILAQAMHRPAEEKVLPPVAPDPLATNPLNELPSSIRTVSQEPASQGLGPNRSWQWVSWIALAASVTWIVWNNFLSTDGASRTPLALATQRDRLLSEPGTTRIFWAAGPQPFATDVSGDVLWNQGKQQGFMSFQGMPANDPTIEQYQLWIIDPERDEQPIDGGVFDISSAGLVIVPIDAKLRVLNPKAFAVTIEKPGGVVVSDQERLPLLAASP